VSKSKNNASRELKRLQEEIARYKKKLEDNKWASKKTNEGIRALYKDLEKMHETLQESEERFKDIVDNTTDWIWEADKDMKYTFASGKVDEILGYESKELIGKTPFDLMPESEAERISEIFKKNASEKKPIVDLENWNLTKEGKRICLLTNGIPLLSESGELMGYRGVDKDITDCKKADESLKKSEEKFRLITENSIDCIWKLDTKLRFTYLSPSLERIMGFKPEQWVGTKISSHFKKREFLKVGVLAAKAIANYKTFTHVTFETKMLNSKNEEVDVEISSKVLLDSQGKLIGLQGITRDITERKQAEENLRNSERKLSQIVNGNSIPALVIDNDHVITNWNNALEQLSGLSTIDMVGTKDQWKAFYPKEQRCILADLIVDNASSEEIDAHYHGKYRKSPFVKDAYEVEDFFLGLDDNGKWLNFSAIPLKDTNGSIIGAIETLQDITERKNAEDKIKGAFQEIKMHEKKLEMVNEHLDSFSYSVSHDLRAPLRAISGFSQILLDTYGDKVDDEMRHYLDRISEGAQKMGRLIDDLLSFSRSTRGEMKYEQMDVEKIVNDLVKAHRDIELDRDIEFVVNPLGTVEADKGMLKVVFANLLQNAIKFTIGREKACIEIGGEQKEDHIQFYVKDNGIGFDMKYKDKLFEAFQQLQTDEKFMGSGIGLATVERIVSKHGGNVWAEGEVDKGSTFYFTLPSKTHIEE